jgi:hypothetical protein
VEAALLDGQELCWLHAKCTWIPQGKAVVSSTFRTPFNSVQGTPSQCAEGSPNCLTGDQLIAALGFDEFTVCIPSTPNPIMAPSILPRVAEILRTFICENASAPSMGSLDLNWSLKEGSECECTLLMALFVNVPDER